MSVCACARVVVWKTAINSEKQALFNKNQEKKAYRLHAMCQAWPPRWAAHARWAAEVHLEQPVDRGQHVCRPRSATTTSMC